MLVFDLLMFVVWARLCPRHTCPEGSLIRLTHSALTLQLISGQLFMEHWRMIRAASAEFHFGAFFVSMFVCL